MLANISVALQNRRWVEFIDWRCRSKPL